MNVWELDRGESGTLGSGSWIPHFPPLYNIVSGKKSTNANDPLGGRGKWYKFEGAFILLFSILILENLERNLNAAVLEPFPVILEGSWQMQEHF